MEEWFGVRSVYVKRNVLWELMSLRELKRWGFSQEKMGKFVD